MSTIQQNIIDLREVINQTAIAAGRNPAEVTIVAVTKTVPVNTIKEAVESGLFYLGENRVQELVDKFPQVSGVEWHLIGHLQSNKVKYIVDKVSMVHSLDSLPLATEINKKMLAVGRTVDVLVQVNISQESTKSGIRTEETIAFINAVSTLPGLKVKGLMTVAPFFADGKEARPVFRRLKLLAEEVQTIGIPGVQMKHLSMGMSNDYRVAIEEGATLIRLGNAIFGSRNK